MLSELTDMGFGEARAARALHHSGNSTVEGAVSWLTEHEGDADLDEPLMVAKVGLGLGLGLVFGWVGGRGPDVWCASDVIWVVVDGVRGRGAGGEFENAAQPLLRPPRTLTPPPKKNIQPQPPPTTHHNTSQRITSRRPRTARAPSRSRCRTLRRGRGPRRR